jgi:type I restriction enzyme S subunit
MELKEGYKQTEVGIIPIDWEVQSLGDICIKIQDGNYGGSYPKSNEFLDYGIPFLTSKAIGKDGVLKRELIDFISAEKHLELKKAHLELNDVLFTNRGASVGAIGLVEESFSHGNIGPQLTLLRPNKETITSRFLFQAMKSEIVQKQIYSQDSGSAMNFFSIGATKKFLLPCPSSITEQGEIAAMLSSADELITTVEKLIAKKRNIKQGAMQKLLQPTEGWEVKTYGEVFDFLSTAAYSRAELTENDEVHYIHYGDIHTKWNVFLDIKESHLPTVTNQQVNMYHFLKEGDVIMADASEDYAGVGKSVEVKNLGSVKAISGLHTFLLRDIDEVFVNGFRGYIHLNKFVKTQFDRLATGLKVYGVSKANLKTVKIPVPPKAEQMQIATILIDMDKEISALEYKLKKYKNVKLGMMQTLLTGKIRLV